MVFSVIGALILLYSCFNFKKGFLIYLLFQIIWFPNGKIITMEGVPSVPLYLIMSLGFTIIYISKGGFRAKLVKFPFMVPLFILSVSRILTCFTSLEGFLSELTRATGYILGSFIEVVLIWRVVQEEKDFNFLIKRYGVIFLFACLYGLIEYFIKDNPLITYKSTLTPQGINTYGIDIFRGYRVMSFFEHPIGAGMTFGLFALLALFYWINRKKKQNNFYLVVALMSILCIVLTKMRSSILFTLIAFFAVMDLSNKRVYKLILLAVIGAVAAFPLYQDSIDIFLSLFSSSAQQAVGGSNIDMRITQFAAVVNIMKNSFLFGFGEQCASYLPKVLVADALGFESIWFEAMARYGLVGVIGNIIFLIYMVILVPRKYKCKQAFWLGFSYWVTYTLTSTPFFRMSLLYYVYFYFIKQSKKYKTACEKCNILPEKKLLTLKNVFRVVR